IREKYKAEKFILFGHSMGALVTSSYLQNQDSPYPHRAFLSAPPVGIAGIAGKLVKWIPKSAMNSFCSLPVSVPLPVVDFRHLSHDSQVALDYARDEFNQLKLHSRLLLQLVDHAKRVFSRPLRPRCPVFCAMGSEDTIVDYPSAKQYFSVVEKNVQFKTIKGAWHEMHNEIDRFRKPYFEFLKKSLEGVFSV
ncbi:MAG: alpha/beta hydrolase, partial [Halobacteriovoraceae bacterium]|nr:alpha/beta hydrolase [Halobacteriovoraceae bacterium]